MSEIILEKRYPHSREEDITDAFMRGYVKGKADRPQGEWVKDKSKNIWNMVVDCYKCSNCGKKAIDHSLILDTTGLSYCPNCGCRMKGADDE